MFSSIQIKQEYNNADDRSHPNMGGGQGNNIDYTVFDNQNVEYAYNQLPHFWDQALQVQTQAIQYPKDFSLKNDGLSRQDVSRFNQNISSTNTNYLSNQLQQQQQHDSFSNNQQCDGQSHLNQVNPSSINPEQADSRIAVNVNNSSLIDSTLAALQSGATMIKRNNPGRPSKSLKSTSTGSTTSSTGKKIKCQCEICFKEFGHKSNLFIHMRTHNGERPYKCKECDKCFTHSGNLAIHMRTHSGERPYACQVCGKMFSHSGNLSTHLRTHSGVKPYKCSVCSKEFRHSGNLSIHERIHSGIKPFQCKVCGKEFYHSGNLTTHMKKHTVIVSSEQCENNVLPVLNAEYGCNNINQSKETDGEVIGNAIDLNNIQNTRQMLGEELSEESNTS